MTSYEDDLDDHVRAFFGGHAATSRTWDGGRGGELNPAFHIVEVGPGPRTSGWTYITAGAGRKAPAKGRRLEFVLCARERADRHVHLLYMTAHYHLTGETLDVGHMFSIGEPWIPGSSLDSMLISHPYPFGQALEVFDRHGHRAHLLWLTPITRAEREFAHRAGAPALEAMLEEQQIDYLDPVRSSVVGEN